MLCVVYAHFIQQDNSHNFLSEIIVKGHICPGQKFARPQNLLSNNKQLNGEIPGNPSGESVY